MLKDRSTIYLFIAIIFVLVVAIGSRYLINRDSTQETEMEGQSNDGISAEFSRINQPNVFFFSKVFLDETNTFISLPYKFEGETPMVWLSLQTENEVPKIIRLVNHPLFNSLDWSQFTEDYITLYQRDEVYSSIQELLANPPESDKILVDSFLLTRPPFEAIEGIIIEPDTTTENIDFILTSYKPSRVDGDTYYYETIINANQALPNPQNELSWNLLIPLASEENPFYIGNIHVDYR